MQFNIIQGKRKKLIELLSTSIDRRKNYTLYISTCYFSIEQLRTFAREVMSEIRVNSIEIYLDKRTAFLYGKSQLENLMANLNKVIPTYIFISKKSNLCHTKAYALVAYNQEEEIKDGALVISSANCTGAGLSNSKDNIESFLESYDLEKIETYLDSLTNKYNDLDEMSPDFDNSYDLVFVHTLINSGYFYYKWQDSLNKFFRTTFKLTKKGKEEFNKQENLFSKRGFSLETASIGKMYFDFFGIALASESKIQFYHSIETRLGKWVPKNIIQEIFLDEVGFENFNYELKERINVQKKTAIDNLMADYKVFIESGLIEESEDFSVNNNAITKKIERLNDKNATSILERIYYQLVQFELPYDIENIDSLNEMYDEMIEICKSRAKKSNVHKAFLESVEKSSLVPINTVEIEYSN